MTEKTTISINIEDKKALDKLKVIDRESYADVIHRLIRDYKGGNVNGD